MTLRNTRRAGKGGGACHWTTNKKTDLTVTQHSAEVVLRQPGADHRSHHCHRSGEETRTYTHYVTNISKLAVLFRNKKRNFNSYRGITEQFVSGCKDL